MAARSDLLGLVVASASIAFLNLSTNEANTQQSSGASNNLPPTSCRG
jgi:hypothetical protein